MRRSGFTLIELLVSVTLLVLTMSIALFAAIGVNSTIAKTDNRSLVAEASRSVADAIRRNVFNAPVGATTVISKTGGGPVYAAATLSMNGDQVGRTCTVIGSGYVNTSGEYLLEPINDTPDIKYGIILKLFKLSADAVCPTTTDEVSADGYYQTKLTDDEVEAVKMSFSINSVGSKQQLRYDLQLKSLRSSGGLTTEGRNPSVALQSSVPIGLVETPPVPLTITTGLSQIQESIYYKLPLSAMGFNGSLSDLVWTAEFSKDTPSSPNNIIPSNYKDNLDSACGLAVKNSYVSHSPGSPTDSIDFKTEKIGDQWYLTGFLGRIASNGAVNLTPRAKLTVTDAKGNKASRDYILNVIRNDIRPVVLTSSTLPEATIGQSYQIDGEINNAPKVGGLPYKYTLPILQAIGATNGNGPNPDPLNTSSWGCDYRWSYELPNGSTTYDQVAAGAPKGLQIQQAAERSGRFLICYVGSCELPVRQIIACKHEEAKTYTFTIRVFATSGTANADNLVERKTFTLKVNDNPSYTCPF